MKEFRTKSGQVVATDFTRVVHGGRGSYIEFKPEHIVKDSIFMPTNQEWRLKDPKWKDQVFYLEYRTKTDNIKVYYQKRLVDYADYKLGLVYISLKDLMWEGDLE